MRMDFIFSLFLCAGLVVAGYKLPKYDFLSTAGLGGGAGAIIAAMVGGPAGAGLLIGGGAGAAFQVFEVDKALGGVGWGGANRFLASGSFR